MAHSMTAETLLRRSRAAFGFLCHRGLMTLRTSFGLISETGLEEMFLQYLSARYQLSLVPFVIPSILPLFYHGFKNLLQASGLSGGAFLMSSPRSTRRRLFVAMSLAERSVTTGNVPRPISGFFVSYADSLDPGFPQFSIRAQLDDYFQSVAAPSVAMSPWGFEAFDKGLG